MTTTTLPVPDIVQIARESHACWCQMMQRRGWRLGPYDEHAKTHDALVPFDRLEKRDRLSAVRAARYDAVDELAALIHYTRGPDRDFVLEEMQAGLRIVATTESAMESADHGEVIDWKLDDEGELERVIVKWNDGEVTEHAAFSGELARAAEL